MTAIPSHTTLLAAADLVSWFHSLYTIGVGVVVVFIVLAGGLRAIAALRGGRIAETVVWTTVAVAVVLATWVLFTHPADLTRPSPTTPMNSSRY